MNDDQKVFCIPLDRFQTTAEKIFHQMKSEKNQIWNRTLNSKLSKFSFV